MLKYLFTVQYNDGTEYKQNPEDKSLLDDKRSCFYDVLNSGKDVKSFTLSGAGHTYAVDLLTGEFYFDGVGFIVGELVEGKRKLIFYRQHTHNFNVDFEELSHQVVYFIGYEVKVKGKNEVRTIGVK